MTRGFMFSSYCRCSCFTCLFSGQFTFLDRGHLIAWKIERVVCRHLVTWLRSRVQVMQKLSVVGIKMLRFELIVEVYILSVGTLILIYNRSYGFYMDLPCWKIVFSSGSLHNQRSIRWFCWFLRALCFSQDGFFRVVAVLSVPQSSQSGVACY